LSYKILDLAILKLCASAPLLIFLSHAKVRSREEIKYDIMSLLLLKISVESNNLKCLIPNKNENISDNAYPANFVIF